MNAGWTWMGLQAGTVNAALWAIRNFNLLKIKEKFNNSDCPNCYCCCIIHFLKRKTYYWCCTLLKQKCLNVYISFLFLLYAILFCLFENLLFIGEFTSSSLLKDIKAVPVYTNTSSFMFCILFPYCTKTETEPWFLAYRYTPNIYSFCHWLNCHMRQTTKSQYFIPSHWHCSWLCKLKHSNNAFSPKMYVESMKFCE